MHKAAVKAVREKQDKIEGSGLPDLNSCGVSEMEEEDLIHAKDCCMQCILSLEKDFCNKKPLLQLVIEKVGHKCLFLLHFHCKLNPIEMVWAQAKRRKVFQIPR